jgi:LuxR family maltose regulon positive regulatory protein
MPPAPAHVVPPDLARRLPRPRLQQRLGALFGQPGVRAVWIGACTGSGKTTLAAACAAGHAAALWLRLDTSDADPAALLAHLGEALRHTRGAAAGAVLPAPSREQLAQPELLLRGQLRALFAALPAPCLLVFDDLQALAEEASLAGLVGTLIDEARAGQQILLLSQRDAPPALARAIGAGRLLEFDATELAFDTGETAAWLALGGAAAEAAELQRESGGWPVAVALLTQRRGAQRLRELIEHGLWPGLDEPTRAALDACAWLPAITADDADPQVLDRLADRALLLDRCSGTPRRWRLHELLSAFLRERQRAALAPGELAARLADSAQRLEARGECDAALALRQTAAQADPAAWGQVDGLLRRIAPAWLAGCRHASLRQAALAVPEALRSAELCWRIAQAELVRDPSAARAWADMALERAPADATALSIQCHTLAIASHFQAFDDTRPLAARVAALEALGVRADDHAAPAEQRAAAAVAVWSALFLREPAHPACSGWQARVLALLHEPVDPNLKLRAAMLLAKNAWYQGRHLDIAPLSALARAELARPGVAPYARLLWGLLRQYAAWADGDWEGGLQATHDALADGAASGIALLDQHLRLHGASFATLAGDDAGARQWLDQVAQRADASRRMEAWHHFTVRGWLLLRRGEAAPAEAAARVAIEAAQAMGPGPLAMSRAVRAHALQQLGDAAALHAERDALAAIADATGNVLAQVHVLLLDAITALDLGDHDGARRRIARALAGMRVEGLWAPMGSAPGTLARLLALALESGIEVQAAARVVRTMRLAPPPQAGAAWPWPVRVHTLGRFAIEVDGEPLPAQGKQQKRPLDLLQALVAHGGEAPAARLADLLWPDAEGDLALGAFEAALRRLRQMLRCGEALRLSGGVLSLDRQRVWVDALAAGPAGAAADFLPGQDAAWAAPARARLARRVALGA